MVFGTAKFKKIIIFYLCFLVFVILVQGLFFNKKKMHTYSLYSSKYKF